MSGPQTLSTALGTLPDLIPVPLVELPTRPLRMIGDPTRIRAVRSAAPRPRAGAKSPRRAGTSQQNVSGRLAPPASFRSGVPVGARVLPGLATNLVQRVGRPPDDVEWVGALHRVRAAFRDDVSDPTGLIGGHVRDGLPLTKLSRGAM